MSCCTLLYVHSSIAIILMGKRELVALLNLSSWYLVMVERLFLTVPQGCLRFVIMVFPDHNHFLFLYCSSMLIVDSKKVNTVPECSLLFEMSIANLFDDSKMKSKSATGNSNAG